MEPLIHGFVRDIGISDKQIVPLDVCNLCMNYFEYQHDELILLQIDTQCRMGRMPMHHIHINNLYKKDNIKYTSSANSKFHFNKNNETMSNQEICYAQNIRLPSSILNKFNISNKEYNILFTYSSHCHVVGYVINKQTQSVVLQWILPRYPQGFERGYGKLLYSKKLGLIQFGTKKRFDDNGLKINYHTFYLSFTDKQYLNQKVDTYNVAQSTPFSVNNQINIFPKIEPTKDTKWQCKHTKFGDGLHKIHETELDSAGCCLIDNDKILKIGGDTNGYDVMLYDVMNAKYAMLKQLRSSRFYFGSCYDEYKQNVYIAGGNIGNQVNVTHSSECYNFYKNKWYDLPPTTMQHYRPTIMWNDRYRKNLLYIASISRFGVGIEYIDLRKKNYKWTATHFEGANQSIVSLFNLKDSSVDQRYCNRLAILI